MEYLAHGRRRGAQRPPVLRQGGRASGGNNLRMEQLKRVLRDGATLSIHFVIAPNPRYQWVVNKELSLYLGDGSEDDRQVRGCKV